MTSWARRDENNIVQEVWPPGGLLLELDISEVMTPEAAAAFVQCPDNVQQGWFFDGIQFRPLGPADEPSQSKADLIAAAADKRWRVEVGGIRSSNSGHPIKTDADSQRKVATLNSAYASGLFTGSVEFKLADGTFVAADAAIVGGFYIDIQTHIKVCYDAESACVASINAGTTTKFSEVAAFFDDIAVLL